MSTTYSTTGLTQTTASTPRVSSPFKNFWGAFQEWCQWERLRTDLCNLNERELMDIGITRGEIDYVASRQTHSRHDVDVSSPGGRSEVKVVLSVCADNVKVASILGVGQRRKPHR